MQSLGRKLYQKEEYGWNYPGPIRVQSRFPLSKFYVNKTAVYLQN